MQATETQIVDSRILNVPGELAFRMFTDLEHISNWWGPRGFTTKTEQMDVRPGGTEFCARGERHPGATLYDIADGSPARSVDPDECRQYVSDRFSESKP